MGQYTDDSQLARELLEIYGDTTAAMAGAISGALNRLGAVPAALAGRLNDQETWDTEALAGLAEKAFEINAGS